MGAEMQGEESKGVPARDTGCGRAHGGKEEILGETWVVCGILDKWTGSPDCGKNQNGSRLGLGRDPGRQCGVDKRQGVIWPRMMQFKGLGDGERDRK